MGNITYSLHALKALFCHKINKIGYQNSVFYFPGFCIINPLCYTLSGRIGKVVALHAEGCNVARSMPAVAELHRFILCTRRSEGTAHVGGGCDQSIGSTVSDAIVRR